jgi:hypothetical protein
MLLQKNSETLGILVDVRLENEALERDEIDCNVKQSRKPSEVVTQL